MVCVVAPRRHAFTLIELLVVIAIVVVLVAISFPVYKLVQEMARSTKCLSNLRQIGLAALNYERDHDNTFPGPLEKGQTAWFTASSTRSIAVVLGPYLGITPSDNSQYAPILMCPSFALQSTKGNMGHAYVVQNNWLDNSGQRIWPFGNTATPPLAPMRPTTLNVNLTTTWAVTELDLSWFPNSPGTWTTELPATPVHGTYRNAIFFDFHAGRVSGANNAPN